MARKDYAAAPGNALLHLGRFAEAIEALTPALPREGEDSFVPERLALAYLGAGDERSAEATLRRYYLPATVPLIMSGLRTQLANLRR